MGDKYMVYLAKYPYQGYWERMQGFKDFDSAIEFVKDFMERGYDIIDIKCRDIKESERHIPEYLCFGAYTECTKWCEEHN